MGRALISLANAADRLVVGVGRIASWAMLALMLVILSDVILRRYFVIGSTQLQELEWHLHGALFLLTLAFGYIRGSHVRIELLREHWQPRTKIWVELAGLLLFYLPYCIVVLMFSLDYTAMSISWNESSPSPTGLPMRWIIKSVLVAGFGLLTLTGLAMLLRCTIYLFGPADLKGGAGLEHILEDNPETA